MSRRFCFLAGLGLGAGIMYVLSQSSSCRRGSTDSRSLATAAHPWPRTTQAASRDADDDSAEQLSRPVLTGF